MKNIKIDISLREIISKLPHKFIEILTNKKGVKLLDTALPDVKDKRADLVVELEDNTIFHLEVQSENDKFMAWRMLEYYFLIKQKYKNYKIYQMVLFVGDKKLNIQNKIKEDKISFEYDLKDIRDINCVDLLNSKDLEDKILAVLCKIESEDKYINSIIDEILKLDEKERKDYIKKLFSLSRYRANINKKLIKSIKERVMPITIDLQNDPYYKEGIQAGIQKGIQKGIQTAMKQSIKGVYLIEKDPKKIAKILNIDENFVIETLKEIE